MKKIAFLFLLSLSLSAMAQTEKNVTYNFYGFVRNEFYYDSHKGLDAAMDQFYLLPIAKEEDTNGEDINEQGTAHLTAVASRLGVNFTGPLILGAKSTANIEADFAGVTTSDPVLIRLRKAYFNLAWEKSSLLVGQNWHPFWGGKDFPSVAGLNTGAPFQPFNRSPQVCYNYKVGKVTVSGTALYESQYVSKGFYTTATNTNLKTLPKRNAKIPEMVASATYNSEKITIGAAAQYNAIKPIDKTTGTAGTFVSKELNTSSALMAYGKYQSGQLSVLAKAVYGQNLVNLTMVGGYGVKSIDAETGGYTYTNYTTYTAFVDAVYGKKYQVGLFVGTGKNLGTGDALATNSSGSTITAGMLQNVQNMSRFAPRFAYNVSQFRFIAEYERTSAAYGTGSINLSNGLYDSSEKVTNNRVIFVAMFLF